MNGYRLAGAIGALMMAGVMAAQAPARAAEPLVDAGSIPGTFSANVGIVSEYFFRGISQTDDSPALQGGMDYEVGLAGPVGAYVGVWGSTVDFNDGDEASVEIDVYGGLRGTIGTSAFNWDVGFIYYSYPGAASNLDYDFVEAQGALGYDFGVASVTGSINWSPENFGESGEATYYKLAVGAPVFGKVDLGAYVARQHIDDEAAFGAPDYWEWNVSAAVDIAGFDVGVAYTATDIPGDNDASDDMVYFSVSRSF